MKYKYDVFISYSRRDYVDESYNVIPGNAIAEIQNVFDENGITYWFDKDGIYSGQEFIEIITGAIAESKMLISYPPNIRTNRCGLQEKYSKPWTEKKQSFL